MASLSASAQRQRADLGLLRGAVENLGRSESTLDARIFSVLLRRIDGVQSDLAAAGGDRNNADSVTASSTRC